MCTPNNSQLFRELGKAAADAHQNALVGATDAQFVAQLFLISFPLAFLSSLESALSDFIQ